MEPETIDTDVQAKVEVQCGNHIYGQYIAEKIENLIKKHGSIKADEILESIDEKVEAVENLESIKDGFEGRIEYLRGEVKELEDEVDECEDKIEELQEEIDSRDYIDGVIVEVEIKSENYIIAAWAAEEVARIIKAHGTVKAYEIFKSIK